MQVEEYRQKREMLDRIEAALAERIRKSDQYLPSTVNPSRSHFGTHEYSARENAFRRLETKKLVEKYNESEQQLKSASASTTLDINLESELQNAATLSDTVLAKSEATKWSSLSNTRGLQRFTCEITSKLPLTFNTEYPVPEQYGQQVWLEPFYQQGLASRKIPESSSYRDYLATLPEIYSSENEPKLAAYLAEAYDRAHSLGANTETSSADILSQDTQETDKLWCEVCNYRFANENVFKNHFNGKKHKRASQLRPDSTMTRNSQELIALMAPQIKMTISELDRKSRMGLSDRQLELEAIEQDRAAEDDWISDDEHLNPHKSDGKDAKSQQDEIPRAPDGTPIPRWLYKLQGLGRTFKCEICGNAKFSGRKAYDRHFETPRHTSGLAELGIATSPVFNGIGTVKEAKDLAAKSKRQANQIEKEVEDDEGNVMNERMYEDSKKQGLI